MKLFALLALLVCHAAQAADTAWDLLKSGGHVVIMRHALTDPPRGDDPPGFRHGDCSTQRNLSPQGRADSEKLAGTLARHGVQIGEVYSSRYCRCQDTAQLAFGKYETWDVLNGYQGPAPYWEAFDFKQILEIRKRLADPVEGRANRFIVTHNTHMKALLDIWVEPGEMVIVRPQGNMFYTVVGRMKVAEQD